MILRKHATIYIAYHAKRRNELNLPDSSLHCTPTQASTAKKHISLFISSVKAKTAKIGKNCPMRIWAAKGESGPIIGSAIPCALTFLLI